MNTTQRPLRILTIDNGGLQAISVLEILKTVCDELSLAEGHSQLKRPHELFDIIAGVGTGGWLAILLGRYKLDIQQCLTVYLSIAQTITPRKIVSNCRKRNKTTNAISQVELESEIERIILSKGLGEHLIDADEVNVSASTSSERSCHALAVGAVKRTSGTQNEQGYHLFRTYNMAASTIEKQIPGPSPETCRVSKACLATAAARDFLDECEIDGTVYWDKDFPKTHNITQMALKEADALFGLKPALECVINISPGLPSSAEIKYLRQNSDKSITSSKRSQRIIQLLRKIKSSCDLSTLPKDDSHRRTRRYSEPLQELQRSSLDPVTNNISCEVSKADTEYQALIKHHLKEVYGDSDTYIRLEMLASGGESKPYLDDIYQTELSANLVQKFLQRPETKAKLACIRERCEYASMTLSTRTSQMSSFQSSVSYSARTGHNVSEIERGAADSTQGVRLGMV